MRRVICLWDATLVLVIWAGEWENLMGTTVYCLSQGFYVALRLVACAQSGQDVSLSSLNLTVPPPKFVSVTLSLKFKSMFSVNKNKQFFQNIDIFIELMSNLQTFLQYIIFIILIIHYVHKYILSFSCYVIQPCIKSSVWEK